MFQFTGFDPLAGDRITPAGLPHSGIRESMPACGSSRLFAAFRALLRPNTPRHPPYALFSFTFHRLPLTYANDLNPNVFFFLCNFQRTYFDVRLRRTSIFGGSGKT